MHMVRAKPGELTAPYLRSTLISCHKLSVELPPQPRLATWRNEASTTGQWSGKLQSGTMLLRLGIPHFSQVVAQVDRP